jgi:hypothetical protein
MLHPDYPLYFLPSLKLVPLFEHELIPYNKGIVYMQLVGNFTGIPPILIEYFKPIENLCPARIV